MALCRWADKSFPTRPRGRSFSPNASFPRARTDANPLLAGELISGRRAIDNNGIATIGACAVRRKRHARGQPCGTAAGGGRVRQSSGRHLGDLDLDPSSISPSRELRPASPEPSLRNAAAERSLPMVACDSVPPSNPILSSSSASSATRPRLTACLRRSVASSSPCSAISASMPPTVRSPPARRPSARSRLGRAAKPPCAGRRRPPPLAAAAVPLGPEMRIAAALCPKPEACGAWPPSLLWLTGGKGPAKTARTRQRARLPQPQPDLRARKFTFHFMHVIEISGLARGSQEEGQHPNLLGSKG